MPHDGSKTGPQMLHPLLSIHRAADRRLMVHAALTGDPPRIVSPSTRRRHPVAAAARRLSARCCSPPGGAGPFAVEQIIGIAVLERWCTVRMWVTVGNENDDRQR